MKKLTGSIALIAALGSLTATATGHAPGTVYYVGQGPKHQAGVKFRVSEGKIKDARFETKNVRCQDRNGELVAYGVFAGFSRTPLIDNSFRREFEAKKQYTLWVGHVYGADAVGKLRFQQDSYPQCDTGVIRWHAHRVSKERWLQISPSRRAGSSPAPRPKQEFRQKPSRLASGVAD